MISVIMLTYNRKSLVINMIEDILGQTYRDFEYIIIDNGSDDGTSDVLKKYIENDSRIRVITIPKSSIGAARNVGVAHSGGEYIAFVDDDDRVEPDFLEFLISLRDEYDADISMCGATEGDGTTRAPQCLFDEKMVLSGEEAVSLLLGRRFIRNGTATKLYRRNILERFPFVENYRNEDLHTQYKYLLAAKVVVIHGVDKYYITRHAGNVSGFTSDASGWDYQTMRDYLDAYRNRTQYLKENAQSLYDQALYSEWSFMISMIEKIDRFELSDCEPLQQIMKRELSVHREEFLNMPEIQDFERKWIDDYIKDTP